MTSLRSKLNVSTLRNGRSRTAPRRPRPSVRPSVALSLARVKNGTTDSERIPRHARKVVLMSEARAQYYKMRDEVVKQSEEDARALARWQVGLGLARLNEV